MLRKLLSFLCFMALFVSTAVAQTGTLTGTVTGPEGATIPSANVLLQEIQRGAATDANGEYEISNVPVGTYTLRVSFVGYQTYNEQVTIQQGENEVNIQLSEGQVGLDELVVTGYGAQSKRELTGSISSVSSEEIQDVPTQNAAGILQGRAAGVQVSTTSGAPGGGFEVEVRGEGSINAGDDPLYIVDGVQLSTSNLSEEVDESPLNSIAPEDIASIEVLKDAAAAAIYGAQAANGVVLITTKRGQRGDTQIQASVSRGVRTDIDNIEYMDRDQILEYFIRAGKFNFGSREAGESYVRNVYLPFFGYAADTPFDQIANTDWREFTTRTGSSQNYSMSISGGDEKTRFRLSGGYENTEGHIKSSDYQRYRIRSNFDHQVSSKFSTRINIGLTNNLFNGVCEDGFFINCPVSAAAFESPISFPFNEDGSYNSFTRFGFTNNPAVVLNEVTRETSAVSILGDIQGTYNFKPWLSLTTQFGLDWRSTRDKRYDNPIANPGDNGSINESEATVTNFTTNTVLNFRQTFDDVHNVSGLVGLEYRRDFTKELESSGTGFPNKLFSVLNAAATPTFTSGFENEFRTAGYFTNLKYNFDQRYYLSATARYDGSSRFGANERWGFFPSISGRWAIAEEDFFNSEIVEDLALRVGYGVTGNSSIGLYEARGLYGLSGSYSGTSALAPTQLANPNLTWEEARELNIGLDASLWRGRLTVTVDAYQRDNEALLLSEPLPSDSGFGSITRNIGAVRNQGIEFSFNSVNVTAGDFQWSSRFNISFSDNEILELSEGTTALNPGSITPLQVGKGLRDLQIVRWAGVNPADGRPMWYDAEGNITYNPTNEDQVFTGESGSQDAVGGFGNTFRYKGLSLDVFLQGAFGQQALPQQVFFFGQAQIASSFTNGITKALNESWQNPGDIVPIPAPKLGSSAYPGTDFYSQSSSNAFSNTDYIRLKNVTLRYSLPSSLTDQLNLRGVSLYVTGLNLVTWTEYPGFDPEVAGGFTAASYPPARQVNGGITVDF